MSRLRVGVIGAGTMGERHCRVYASLPTVELVGVYDPVTSRAGEVAQRYGTRAIPRLETLLARVDGVSIATPTPAHLPVALECLARGVHILVEKPLAETVSDAEAICAAARRAGVLLQVGHIERFNPAYTELRAILEDLEVVGMAVRRLSPFDTSRTDVDVVFDLMIHDLDLLLDLLGDDVEDVHAQGRAVHTSAIDFAVANIAIRNGPIATITASRVTQQKVRAIEVTAADAYVEADMLNKTVSIYRRTLTEHGAVRRGPDGAPAARYRQESLVERIHVPSAEPLALELSDFVRCIAEGRPPLVDGAAALAALRLASQIDAQVRAATWLGLPRFWARAGVAAG